MVFMEIWICRSIRKAHYSKRNNAKVHLFTFWIRGLFTSAKLHDKLLWHIGGVECVYTSQLNGTGILEFWLVLLLFWFWLIKEPLGLSLWYAVRWFLNWDSWDFKINDSIKLRGTLGTELCWDRWDFKTNNNTRKQMIQWKIEKNIGKKNDWRKWSNESNC